MTCRMEPRKSKHKGMINHHRQEAKRTQLSILNNAIGKNSQEIKLSHSNTEKNTHLFFLWNAIAAIIALSHEVPRMPIR